LWVCHQNRGPPCALGQKNPQDLLLKVFIFASRCIWLAPQEVDLLLKTNETVDPEVVPISIVETNSADGGDGVNNTTSTDGPGRRSGSRGVMKIQRFQGPIVTTYSQKVRVVALLHESLCRIVCIAKRGVIVARVNYKRNWLGWSLKSEKGTCCLDTSGYLIGQRMRVIGTDFGCVAKPHATLTNGYQCVTIISRHLQRVAQGNVGPAYPISSA